MDRILDRSSSVALVCSPSGSKKKFPIGFPPPPSPPQKFADELLTHVLNV